MDEKDLRYIEIIQSYCESIGKTIARFGDSFEIFKSDPDFFNSVSMSILQIGEFAGRLSDSFRTESAAAIPWSSIRAMRTWFAHRYGAVDKDLVWKTAQDDVPALSDFCKKTINGHP
jgi:uncharacterized protein with HEPN domain